MTSESSFSSEIEDRRRFLKRAGTIAWTTPMIMTLLAESASASHLSGCIHQNSECGDVTGGPSGPFTCQDDPPGSGSTTNCCSPNTCRPTVNVNGEPCTCQP